MTERVESDACRLGVHYDCPGCVGCACHPRTRAADPVWDKEPIQDGCRGTHWTPDRAGEPY